MSNSYATEVSFTIDDPGVQSMASMPHLEVGKKILQTLKDNQLKVILFACGKRIDSAEGVSLLKLWDGQGHIIGNHTYSHLNYNSDENDFKFLSQDMLKSEALIKGLISFKKIFRYPMLKEGNTVSKRDEMRAFLKKMIIL